MKNRSLFFPILALFAGLFITIITLNLSSNWQPASAFSDPFDLNFDLTILHTNDIHSHYAPINNDGSVCREGDICMGGSARLKTKIDEISTTNTILIDAGDQFQGTLYYRLFKADIVTDTMNHMGYQAMAVGNHEFDDGPEMLAKLVDGVSFPVLGTNLDVSAEPSLDGKLPVTAVLSVGGKNIGLMGLTTPDTSSSSKPGNVIFKDPLTSAQAAVTSFQNQGIDKIIAITHLGYQEDLELAKSLNGVDIIVGGHSHTFVYTPTNPIQFDPPTFPKFGAITPAGAYPTIVNSPNGDPVLVITEYCWGIFLGNIQVTFDANGKIVDYEGNPIFLSNNIEQDNEIVEMMEPYDEEVQKLYTTVVGTTTVPLPLYEGEELICRLGECLLGDLVSDAILWELNNSSSDSSNETIDETSSYQIALINAGMLRTSLSGTIHVGDIMDVLPYGNTIATFEITGTHLISALESGISRFKGDSGTGRFPQVAGLRYTFDPQKPAGSRLISVEVKTETGYSPLDPTQIYKVATNDYVRQGNDGYTVFRDYAINPYDYGAALDETLEDYVEHLEVIQSQDIITGRIHLSYQTILPFIFKNAQISRE